MVDMTNYPPKATRTVYYVALTIAYVLLIAILGLVVFGWITAAGGNAISNNSTDTTGTTQGIIQIAQVGTYILLGILALFIALVGFAVSLAIRIRTRKEGYSAKQTRGLHIFQYVFVGVLVGVPIAGALAINLPYLALFIGIVSLIITISVILATLRKK